MIFYVFASAVVGGISFNSVRVPGCARRAPRGRIPRAETQNHGRATERDRRSVSSGRKTSAEIARLFKIHRATVSRFVSQARAAA